MCTQSCEIGSYVRIRNTAVVFWENLLLLRDRFPALTVGDHNILAEKIRGNEAIPYPVYGYD
jgi:hypothetical protein